MFELDYLSQKLTFSRTTDPATPTLIGGFAPTFEAEVAEVPVERREPLEAELSAFLDIVQCGGRPEVDAEDGLWAVAIADALLRAAGERRAVELADLAERLRAA